MMKDYEQDIAFMCWIKAKEAAWQMCYEGYYDVIYAAWCAGKESK